MSGRPHSYVAAKSGKESARQERDGNERVLDSKRCKDGEDDEERDKHERHYLVLPEEVRHGSLPHISGNLHHPLVSRVGLLH